MFQQLPFVKKLLNLTESQLFNYLFHANFFMGFCGFVWTISAYILLSGTWLSVNWVWTCCLTFGIIGIYNGARVFLMKKAGAIPDEPTENQTWGLRHIRPLMGITIASFFLSAILLMFLKWDIWLWLGIASVLVLSYYRPFWLFSKDKPKGETGLRGKGWLKNLIIGLVWAILTAIVPMVDLKIDYFKPYSMLLIAERLIFIYLLMIPFDIKDIDADQKAGVLTIPAQIGYHNSKWLMGFLMLFLAMLYTYHYSQGILLAHLLTLLYLGLLTPLLMPSRSSIHFLAFWDGAIALQGILIILLS